jgi:hypothetical protein
VDFVLVDLVGPGASKKLEAPARAKPPVPVQQPRDFKYQLPEGWREAKNDALSRLAFTVGQGEQQARITASIAGGALLDNINRWRKQVGIKPIAEADLPHYVTNLEMAGGKAKVADASGAASRIVGAIFERNGQTWFFKMMGPPDVVGRQRGNFEAFLKSIQFEAS